VAHAFPVARAPHSVHPSDCYARRWRERPETRGLTPNRLSATPRGGPQTGPQSALRQVRKRSPHKVPISENSGPGRSALRVGLTIRPLPPPAQSTPLTRPYLQRRKPGTAQRMLAAGDAGHLRWHARRRAGPRKGAGAGSRPVRVHTFTMANNNGLKWRCALLRTPQRPLRWLRRQWWLRRRACPLRRGAEGRVKYE